jgi:uncharacterized membrane protein YvbJ
MIFWAKQLEISKRDLKYVIVHCIAGKCTTNLVGDLPGFGTVWYDEKAIAKILSLKQVKTKYHVSFDSELSHEFAVAKPDGNLFKFQESEHAQYYLDTNQNVGEVVLINTVSENKARYTTKTDYERAQLARKLQVWIGCPSIIDFIHIVERNLLRNCPFTQADILAAENIFGAEIGASGKTTRHKPHATSTGFRY